MTRAARVDALLAVAYVAGLSALGVALQAPPRAVPASAPAAEFSSGRAMRHVRAIAARPHPMGSEESGRVRGYLMHEMRALGMEPEVLTNRSYPGQSLLGRIPGTAPRGGKVLMLSAHYDSRDETVPGAGDDASGVAAILEAVRALRAGPPLANELWILFTDGEERGLTGARTFVEDTPRRERVGLILNFEARGSRGPSYMFETSRNNGWIIRQLAYAAPYPFATSLTGAVYREMRNSTDLTAFKGIGLNGLNFAFVDGYEDYHRPTDTPENLDPRSLQHHGTYALSLARRFGNLDLGRVESEPDAIYFPAFGPHLIVYGGWLVLPLMAAAGIGYGALVLAGLRRGRLTERGVRSGAVLGVATPVAAALAAYLAWLLIARGRVETPKGAGSPEVALGLMVLGFVVAPAVYAIRWRKTAPSDLAAGSLGVWLALTVIASMRLPGGSYLFLWPTMFGLIGLAARIFAQDPGAPRVRMADYLAALPALALMPPTLQSLCAALGPNAPFVPAFAAGLLVVALVPMVAKASS